MNLLGTKCIQTERLILRTLMITDAEAIFANWASLEEITQFLPWEPSKSVEDVKKRLQEWINSYTKNTFFQWGIELKISKELIAIINLHEVDINNQSAETSYILARKHWNKGFMTEALQAVLKFGFEDVGLNRISAEYFIGNIASEKVVIKNNLNYEGTFREKYLKDGNFYNAVQFGLTKKQRQYKLMEIIHKSGFGDFLKQEKDKLIIVGNSVGAVFLGKDIRTTNDEDIIGIENTNGVGLVEYSICPHYSDDKDVRLLSLPDILIWVISLWTNDEHHFDLTSQS